MRRIEAAPPRPLTTLLILAILIKILTIALVWAGVQVLPVCVPCAENNFRYPPYHTAPLADAFQTWDAQHYLFLAEKGYHPDQMSNAFYPLLPILLRWNAAIFGGNTFFGGLLLVNFISLAAIAFFFRVTERYTNPNTAFSATLILLAFPTAFYFNEIYTEGLFLLFALLAFWAIRRKSSGLMLLSVGLLPLTRAIGALVAIPLGFKLLVTRNIATQERLHGLASVGAGVVLGLGAYFWLTWQQTGDMFGGLAAQQFFFSNYSLQNLLHPLAWIERNFIHITFSLHGFNTSALNRVFFLAFLGGLALVWRKLPPELTLFTALIGLIPALSGELDSFPRYLLVVFPIFIALAMTIPRKKLAWWLIPSAALQMIFLLAHSLNYWVA